MTTAASDSSVKWCVPGDAALRSQALEIYSSAFRATAIPVAQIESLLRSGCYALAVERDSVSVRAMALVATFPSQRFSHLDYLATAKPWRAQGRATRLLEFLVRTLPAEPFGSDLLTLELDGALGPWYARRGALWLDRVPYLFPAVTGPRPMKLMAFAFRQQESLTGDQVRSLVRALYATLHGRPPNDPILAGFVGAIPERVALTVVPSRS